MITLRESLAGQQKGHKRDTLVSQALSVILALIALVPSLNLNLVPSLALDIIHRWTFVSSVITF